MAGSSNYTIDKSNPFFEDVDEDIDDATFLKNSKSFNNSNSTLQDRREQLLREKTKIEERMVQSSFRSLGLLQESEQIGNATAQELITQREQLENTERKLDDINSSLRTSQKHIQSIKSVFGSIKNYFGGRNEVPLNKNKDSSSATTTPTIPKSRSELSSVLESCRNNVEKSSEYNNHSVMSHSESISSTKDANEILDRNLDEMGSAISRLKGLGLGLQDELESQNELLTRVSRKTEDASWRIKEQNKDMEKILKK